jgi:hypothetical protein
VDHGSRIQDQPATCLPKSIVELEVLIDVEIGTPSADPTQGFHLVGPEGDVLDAIDALDSVVIGGPSNPEPRIDGRSVRPSLGGGPHGQLHPASTDELPTPKVAC